MFHWDTKAYWVTVQYIPLIIFHYIHPCLRKNPKNNKNRVIIPQLPLQFSFWAPPLTVSTKVVGIVSPHLESTQFWWGHLLLHGASLFHTDSMLSQAQNIKQQINLPDNHAPLSRHFPPLIAKRTSDGAWNSSARFMSPILNRYMCRVCPHIQIFDKFRETPNEDRSRHQATKGLKGFWVSIHPDLAVLQPGSPEIWWHPNGKIMSKLVYWSMYLGSSSWFEYLPICLLISTAVTTLWAAVQYLVYIILINFVYIHLYTYLIYLLCI